MRVYFVCHWKIEWEKKKTARNIFIRFFLLNHMDRQKNDFEGINGAVSMYLCVIKYIRHIKSTTSTNDDHKRFFSLFIAVITRWEYFISFELYFFHFVMLMWKRSHRGRKKRTPYEYIDTCIHTDTHQQLYCHYTFLSEFFLGYLAMYVVNITSVEEEEFVWCIYWCDCISARKRNSTQWNQTKEDEQDDDDEKEEVGKKKESRSLSTNFS